MLVAYRKVTWLVLESEAAMEDYWLATWLVLESEEALSEHQN